MKGYLLLFLAVAGLLLLLPLPALSGDKTAAAPTVSSPSSIPSSDSSTNQTEPTLAPTKTSEDTFRILCGGTVIELEEREFLIRTLAFEMPPTYHAEALKAQAVAAYTYYARRRAAARAKADPALQGADFTTPDDAFPVNYTTQALQTRWGDQYAAHYNKLCAAVDAVIGKTIQYQGSLIDACYFAISPGNTEDAAVMWGASVPYLTPVASPGDRLSPDYETVVTFTPEQLRPLLLSADADLGLGEDPAAWLGEAALSASGTVTSLAVGNKTLTGAQIRQALSLRSACFSFSYQDKQFCFTVHGYGHCVGMSQYGADYLARQGYTFREILQYYYTGVTIEG